VKLDQLTNLDGSSQTDLGHRRLEPGTGRRGPRGRRGRIGKPRRQLPATRSRSG